jgi:hypothetical protein
MAEIEANPEEHFLVSAFEYLSQTLFPPYFPPPPPPKQALLDFLQPFGLRDPQAVVDFVYHGNRYRLVDERDYVRGIVAEALVGNRDLTELMRIIDQAEVYVPYE